ncbi:MAG: hypothetical protein M1444_00380 [Patescibacteria group bacterium]|nr:hypothetical protein [Patescibacteria group bacterium]
MVEANRGTGQPTAERPSGSTTGMRPLGLAAGFGVHPDTVVVDRRDATTPNTSHKQPDFLARYPWGIFSLIRAIADGKLDSLIGDNQIPATDSETQRAAVPAKK